MTRLKTISRIPGRVLAFAVGSYGVLMALFLLLRPLLGESFVPVAMFNSYLPALFFPAFIFLLACLILRYKRLMVLQLPALLGFILLYGTALLPTPVAAQHSDTQLTLLTYNVSTTNTDYASLARIIHDANADVVAIQELNFPAASYLANELIQEYPYQALNPEAEFSGQGIFSRYPLSNVEYWRIELGHMRAQIDLDGTPVTLYSVHPLHPFLIKRGLLFDNEPNTREINDIMQRAAGESGALLITGDFNMSDQSNNYANLRAVYGDAFRAAGSGLGLTFPSLIPVARLDYVFYNDSLVPLEARVWADAGGSDHFPMFIRLALSNE